MAKPALPVLREIVKTEKDEDLVGRAKLALLRVDPASLTGLPVPEDAPRPAGGRRAAMIKVRITERGKTEPNVSLAMPFALAELVFKSLPDDAHRELRAKGYDADSFWRKLRDMGPTDVIDIDRLSMERRFENPSELDVALSLTAFGRKR